MLEQIVHWFAKALVPFVFVYLPALLLIADEFTWAVFTVTLLGAMVGISLIGAAFTGYLFASIPLVVRWYIGMISLLFIAPGLDTMLFGFVLLVVPAVHQIRAIKTSPSNDHR